MPCNGPCAVGLKKNLPEGDYLLRALELVEAEIELQKTLLPELHARSANGGGSGDPDQPSLSRIGRTPDGPIIRWMLSHHALLELATALHACGAFTAENGDKPSFTDLMRCLCHAFNITVADIYVKRTRMFDRCTNQTPFLDKLKNAFIQIIQKRLK